ncbi:MAG: hypothetical protein C3F13_17840 [Anaerolineales bacterium]|nr:GNAT family N-acetyltransferase [Anaerolineae bacterium]PWB49893.1 MAG: hypothetical protein C3F13_17840 [Anaerolineales bacterium]
MNPLHRLGELFEDWLFFIQHDGLLSAIPIIALDIVRLPYRHLKFLIFACSLENPLPVPLSKTSFEIRPFTKNDLELIREINRPSEVRLCEYRLVHGHFGFIAVENSQAAGYAWGCAEVDAEVERVRLSLVYGDILCNDAFTAPAYRRQGVQTALTIARLQKFKDMGYRRALCYIEANNIPSIAVWQRKLGSTILGEIDFKRFGPWYRVKISISHS